MAAPAPHSQIAVLADPELVDALRFAGVRRCRAIRAAPGAAVTVRETLREWLADEEVGVVVIGTEHAALADEIVSATRGSKRLAPVLLEIPSHPAAAAVDSAAYYQQLSRVFLGLEVVLQDGSGDQALPPDTSQEG